MTKAESQARAYAMENLEGYHPMVRDFILGKGIFSHAEEFKMHMRVADRIAEHARAAFREQFAKEFNDHRANAVVEVPIPPRKNVMPHAWSSDPARDAKVRMQEDGRSEPHKTLEEAIAAPFAEGGECSMPVAWGVVARGIVLATSTSRWDAVDMQSEHARYTAVVPLYDALPPARGWLTEEEREAVADAAETLALRGCGSERRSRILKALLARSTPPEVVLPITLDPFSERLIRDALSAAGVTVREATK